MKAIPLKLLNNVVSSYDKTKTTIFGRVFSKTINSQTVLGPPLTSFIDTETQAGVAPAQSYYNPTTGRKFVLVAPSAGIGTILLYTFDNATGVFVYIGKLQFNYPNVAATTYTARSISVNDNNATWDICLSFTGSVVTNGGLFLIHKLTVADFIPVGFPTIGFATGSDQKAVYFLQDPATPGINHSQTTPIGSEQPWMISGNNKVYLLNGTFLLPEFFVYDLSITPTVDKITTGITITAATPGVVSWPIHGFVTGDQIIFAAATNFPSALTLGTVYFVSATGNTTNSFQISTTLALANAGTSISTIAGPAGTAITGMRAFGICINNFSFKTSILPALSGTAIAVNSLAHALPGANVPTLNGSDCFALCSNTTLYLGKISEIVNAASTWPSLSSANIAGTSIDMTVATVLLARYSTSLDQWVFVTNTAVFVLKKHMNNQITCSFGGVANEWLESLNLPSVPAKMVLITSIIVRDGWLFMCGSTAGQRGIIAADLRSDDIFGYSYITTPVLSTFGYALRALTTIRQLFSSTDSAVIYIKTAATLADATFSSPTTGWTLLTSNADLSAFTLNNFTQIKIGFNIATLFSCSPAQMQEIYLLADGINDISDNWEGSVDNTSQNGASPAYTAFRMLIAYASVVPAIFFRAYDDSGNLVASANTVSNPTLFEYSTNNGTSWNALGTIPNTALTTEVRYKWSSPPGVAVTCSIRES